MRSRGYDEEVCNFCTAGRVQRSAALGSMMLLESTAVRRPANLLRLLRLLRLCLHDVPAVELRATYCVYQQISRR